MTFLDLFVLSGVGGLVAGLVGHFLFRYFLSGYLSEKGKNLATKEDIAAITKEIERVRTQYAVLLEERKATHQLRMAGIDRRMQAHQEAFTLWREILRSVHSENIDVTTLKCQDWWEKNCLYLEQSVREALSLAMSCAHDHAMLLRSREDADVVKKNWANITAAGPAILKAVQLPGLTVVESDQLTKLAGG